MGVGLFVFQFLVLISVFGIFVAWDQKVERTNMLRMGREKGFAVSSYALGIETNTCNDYIYFVIFFCGIDMSWRGIVGTMTLQLSTALKFHMRYANELITMQQAFPWSPSSSAKSRVKGLYFLSRLFC